MDSLPVSAHMLMRTRQNCVHCSIRWRPRPDLDATGCPRTSRGCLSVQHCWKWAGGYFCSAVNWRRRDLTSPPSSRRVKVLASSDSLATSCWNWLQHDPPVAPCKAEDFISEKRFDFAFSLNVMEHIDLPDEAVRRVSEVLKPGASYHFLCPNYVFPYEPHFNIPTFFTKELTCRVMRHRIEGNTGMDDPKGVWRSLTWITVPKVKRFAAKDATLTLRFHRAMLVWMLERALTDKEFAGRRAQWMVAAIRSAVKLRVHHLAGYVPATLQPIMDVRLTKR